VTVGDEGTAQERNDRKGSRETAEIDWSVKTRPEASQRKHGENRIDRKLAAEDSDGDGGGHGIGVAGGLMGPGFQPSTLLDRRLDY
jgi:hypothetical protein